MTRSYPFALACRGSLLLALLAGSAVQAQSVAGLWTDVAESAIRPAGPRDIVPEAYRTLRLDRAMMAARLATAPLEARPGDTRNGVVVPLPLPGGGFGEFQVVEAPVMEAALQARYPEIRSYLGRGLTDPTATVRLSMTRSGLRAQVLSGAGAVYIDPYAARDDEHYVVYRTADYRVDPARVREAYGDEIVEVAGAAERGVTPPSPTDALGSGENLRTYRLALAATGEYTTFHSTRAGNPPNVADALAAQVIAMTRVNGIYERDVAVRMVMIANNDTLIYTNPTTDPFTNNNGSTMLGQNQTLLTTVIGAANYDIGHVFSTGGGGVATLGCVCNDGQKARGVTGLGQPINDIFYVDYVSHEMGHQFAGNHSWNGNAGGCSPGQRRPGSAYEPGSGSTIMGYAGLCGGQDLQPTSDPYFHAISLDEIVAFTTTGGGSTCGALTATGNTPPTVTATGGYVIPVSTPFRLVGRGTDPDVPAALTFAWEGWDLGPAGGFSTTNPPFFRSFNPTPDSARVFPQMSRLLAGLAPVPGENLPAVGRALNFRFTARDNQPVGGIGSTLVTISTDAAAGPFTVTFAPTAGQVFGTGSAQTITWNVAGTNAGGVNTPTVDILYSSDNGATFGTVLAAATPNDGSETVTMPTTATTQGRILIRGVGNVFFNVNPHPFGLQFGVATESGPADAAYALSPARPSPVSATAAATLDLTVAQGQHVRAGVYDVLGRRVADLHDGAVAAGRNVQLVVAAGALPAGTYFVRVQGETFAATRRLVVTP